MDLSKQLNRCRGVAEYHDEATDAPAGQLVGRIRVLGGDGRVVDGVRRSRHTQCIRTAH